MLLLLLHFFDRVLPFASFPYTHAMWEKACCVFFDAQQCLLYMPNCCFCFAWTRGESCWLSEPFCCPCVRYCCVFLRLGRWVVSSPSPKAIHNTRLLGGVTRIASSLVFLLIQGPFYPIRVRTHARTHVSFPSIRPHFFTLFFSSRATSRPLIGGGGYDASNQDLRDRETERERWVFVSCSETERERGVYVW